MHALKLRLLHQLNRAVFVFEGSYPRNLCFSVIRFRTVAEVLRNLPNVHESYWNYTELTECTQKLPELN